MRFIAAMLMLAGCASSDGIIQNKILGGPGQDISVGIIEVETPLNTMDLEGTRQYTVHLEVMNMTDVPLTVDKIMISDSPGGSAFVIQGTVRTFNEMVDPGKEHVFLMPLRGRLVRKYHSDESRNVEFTVVVGLTNGDYYEYTFQGPVMDAYSPPS